MDSLHLLNTVITSPAGGYLCLSTAGNGGNEWTDYFYRWPEEQHVILEHAERASKYNVYFSAHLFEERTTRKEAVLPTRTIQADLDGADIYSLGIPPTALMQTSVGRHQAFWVLKDLSMQNLNVPLDVLENYSRRLSYSIPDCDRTGWPLGKRLRFPNTTNHKYSIAQSVEIVSIGARRIDPVLLEILPEVPTKYTLELESWIDLPHAASILSDVPPLETILALQKSGKISASTRTQYSNPAKDRSNALWRLMLELFGAGCSRELVYWLSYNSRNNKFKDRRYGGTRDLRKDIMRAEIKVVTPDSASIKDDIQKLRKDTSLDAIQKNEKIARLIQTYMQSRGSFINANDGDAYFVKADTGRPIVVNTRDKMLASYINLECGVNASTDTYKYAIHHLAAYCNSITTETDIAVLSFFDLDNRVLYLHTGKRDVIVLTGAARYTVPNGSGDMLFKWSRLVEPFTPNNNALPAGPSQKWYEFLFDSNLEYVLEIPRAQARAILAVWLVYTLIRSDLNRPILALFGQPGSGKSAMLRKVYRLLYGRSRDLNFLSSMDDFKHTTSENPLVVFDNADTWYRWLPDMLATSISNTTTETRKLFTDKETIEHRRQAMVALTAHSPKFIREDVADRLIVLNFERRPEYGNEKQIQDEVTNNRGALWGAIINDVQTILGSPLPADEEVPQFRLQDFATYGMWIAKGIDPQLGADFRAAIDTMRGSQSTIVVEGDEQLVRAFDKAISARARSNRPVEFMTTADWFSRLEEFADDTGNFRRIYKNAAHLGRRLWTLQTALKTRFRIEWSTDARTGARTWLIDTK